ncbi:MAG: phospholipase D-like domain-containing protein [Microthrixaceae bacterium]
MPPLALGLLLDGAEDRVRATTAYFTPDESMLEAICGAARRGVKVQVLIPGEHIDKDFVRWASEADYDLLLEAGVEVCVFEPSMLHAKVMTADGRVAVVGSSNINTRSSSEDDEVLMVVFDPDVVATLDSHFDDDLTRSSPVDPADWAERGILQRAREAVMSKVSDVL